MGEILSPSGMWLILNEILLMNLRYCLKHSDFFLYYICHSEIQESITSQPKIFFCPRSSVELQQSFYLSIPTFIKKEQTNMGY